MSKRSRQYRKQPSDAKKALAKGIVPIRREIAPVSYKLFKDAGNIFKTEFRGAGRVYDEDTIAVTLIGFSRFDKRLQGQGPKTGEVIEKVKSCQHEVDVKLGGLGIYGSKLAFELHSEELYDEIEDLEQRYQERGFPLKAHPFAGGNGYMIHATIVNLYQQGIEHFRDKRALEHLNSVAAVLGQTATLKAVDPPRFK